MRHIDEAADAHTGTAAAALGWAAPGLVLVHVTLLLIPGGVQHSGALTTYGLIGVGVCAATAQGTVAALLRRTPRGLAAAVFAFASPSVILTAMIVVALGHAALRLALAPTPAVSALLALVLLGSGGLLVRSRWLTGTVAAGVGAWGIAMAVARPSDVRWSSDGVIVLCAAAGAFGLSAMRRRELQALRDVREFADEVAVRDHVTGLANRRGLVMLGSQLLEVARRQGDAVHCVFVDVDGFAGLTHELGEDVATEVLIAVSDALRTVTRSTDVVARWRNDTFTVVGPGPGMAPLELERRVRERLLAEEVVDPTRWELAITAGGSMLAPWDGGDLDALLTRSDQELNLRRRLRREATPLPRRDAAI